MLYTHKNYLFLFIVISSSLTANSTLEMNHLEEDEEFNPYDFIDSNAQRMVEVLKNEADLFNTDRPKYEQKIKDIFEPMIDFKRVAASVMDENTIY